jgi:hypothetical protein
LACAGTAVSFGKAFDNGHFSITPNGSFDRTATTRHLKMLHVARMAGLAKLRCGIVTDCGGRLWVGCHFFMRL